jgi:uncharacterized membrane protein
MDFLHHLFSGLCHQIPERAVSVGDAVMPVCARCAGMYVAFAAALPVFLLRAKRRGGLPTIPFCVIASLALAAYVLDGAANTFRLADTPAALRFGYGALVGLFLSPLVASLAALTFDWDTTRRAAGIPAALVFIAASAAGAAANVRPLPLLIAAESWLAAVGAVALVALVHTALLTLILRPRRIVAVSAALLTTTAQFALLAAVRRMLGI